MGRVAPRLRAFAASEGRDLDEEDAGHVTPLARPGELVDLLERYRAEVTPA